LRPEGDRRIPPIVQHVVERPEQGRLEQQKVLVMKKSQLFSLNATKLVMMQ
jgi:hypothetical protein